MLPTNPQERKEIQIYSGVLMYFPKALAEIAKASKSGDELDALTRHLIDTDGVRHSAKVAWRALAALEKEIEKAELEFTLNQ